MRVTFNQVRDGIDAINTASEQFAEAQFQVSTGLRVRNPSDDPAAAQRVVQDQSEIAQLDAYTSTTASASSRVSAMDSALGDIVDKITSALVSLQSAQGSTATQAARDVAATSLEGIRDAIAADINTSFGGVHLFAGANSDQAPYVKVGGNWVYQGNNAAVTVDISDGHKVSVAMDGQGIMQGSDPQDLLTLLDSAAAAARSNTPATMASSMQSLDSAMARVSRALGQVGYDETSVSDAQSRVSALKLAASARLSGDRDVNMAEAMTRMSRAQTTYQSALGAVAATSKQSLLDYLK